MKNFFYIFLILFFLNLPNKIQAQNKPIINIGTVYKDGNLIYFTLTSIKPFLVANNIYVLFIGDKKYLHYKQSLNNGKGLLSFIIPSSDFKNFMEESKIYLVYGDHNLNDLNYLDNLSKQEHYPCWYLGHFNKDLLKDK